MLFTLLIAPLASLFIFTWLFSAGVVSNLPVTIVDEDHSDLSRRIVQMVEATPASSVESFQNNLFDAKDRMEKGLTDAILVLPKNLERDVSKGQSPPVKVYINNTNLLKGGTLKSALYKTLATASTGVKVQTYMKSGLSQRQALNLAMPINIDAHILFNPYGNYAYFLLLGILPLMLNVFVFLGSTYAIGIELKEKTAAVLMKTANGSIITAITAKLLPYTLIFFFHCLLMNFVFFAIVDFPLNGSLGIILLAEILQVLVYQLLAVLIIGITSNLRLSLSLGSAYTMMALSFAGLTFPLMGMPKIAQLFSYVFPYTYWIEVFMSQTLRWQPLSTVVLPLSIIMLFIVVSMLAFPLLKKRYSNPIYWGKI